MKLNFPAPEVWFAESEEEAARKTATALVQAGIDVAWIPGSVLAQVPAPVSTTAVAFDGDTMTLTTAIGAMALRRGDRIVAVSGEPQRQEARLSSERRSVLTQNVPGHGPIRTMPFASGIVSAAGIAGYAAINKLDKMAQEAKDAATNRISDSRMAELGAQFLDIYTFTPEGWKAARITQTDVDFSELGAIKQPTTKANIRAILDKLHECFEARLDERLQHVTYKSSVIGGVALNQVLRGISTRLGDLPPMDLGSRLAFLTTKGRQS
ncbi:MAG: hypothetical protein JSW71_09075 [Gemmatimonadota bacterium]|nr:MAG: hypothetical protein JSW71_09075 [Gemmatimonadota bacterium]